MEKEKMGFGYFFDKSLKTLKNNMFVLVPNLIFYIITGAVTMAFLLPMMNNLNSNPYMLMNQIDSNPFKFMGAYFLFLFIIIAISLFVESGNMYMIRNVIKGESAGLSDFMGGLLKYPHKLLGFGLVMFLMLLGVYFGIFLVMLMAMKIGVFLGVILGIAIFVGFVFLAVVFQPYDAVMAVGDNGAMDTVSKTFSFGKSNFLTIFLLSIIVALISLLFQGAASVTNGVSSFGASASGMPEFSMIPFIIVYIMQMLVGLILRVFSRIFKFHLYQENSSQFDLETNAGDSILGDYVADDFSSSNLDLRKSDNENLENSEEKEDK